MGSNTRYRFEWVLTCGKHPDGTQLKRCPSRRVETRECSSDSTPWSVVIRSDSQGLAVALMVTMIAPHKQSTQSLNMLTGSSVSAPRLTGRTVSNFLPRPLFDEHVFPKASNTAEGL